MVVVVGGMTLEITLAHPGITSYGLSGWVSDR